MTAAGKEFNLDNPAMNFVTPPDAQEKKATKATSKGRPKSKAETKSERFNILMKPSTVEALKKLATMKQTSVSGIINDLAEGFIEDEQEALKMYDKVFK